MPHEPKTNAGPVPIEALDYFKAKKIRPAFSYTEVWQQEHDLAFTVAKVMEKSILKTVRDSLQSALEEGTPFEEWKKQVRPALAQSGWAKDAEGNEPARLATIYDTNMRQARANGQADRAQRVKSVLPYFEYELGPSKVHREEHEALEGLTLPVDDPFWAAGNYPPSDFGCKCSLRQITQEEADEGEGPDDSSTDEDALNAEPNEAFAYPKDFRGRQEALDQALEDDE